MDRNNLLDLSYPCEEEKKLKLVLINRYEEYGINKVYISLMSRNQLLLNSCNIDENKFNFILFKNYIYFLNDESKTSFQELSNKDKDVIEEFNKCINNNDFDSALNIYMNNYIVYQLLCSAYIKNLFISEKDKVKELSDEQIDKMYNQIYLLKNKDLSFKREKTTNKVYRKISNR